MTLRRLLACWTAISLPAAIALGRRLRHLDTANRPDHAWWDDVQAQPWREN